MLGVILAGGKSKRFNSSRSKVLHQLLGRPILLYCIDSLKNAGVKDIYIVVGGKSKNEIIKIFKDKVKIIDQKIPLGTGDAVKKFLEGTKGVKGENLIVLPGDAPLLNNQKVY